MLSCLDNIKRTQNNQRPPTKPDMVDISFLVDRSGSMYCMYRETIQGVQSFVDEQKKNALENNTKTHITIKTFDNSVETMNGFDNASIDNIPSEINHSCLKPRNTTRLIDTAYEELLSQHRRYQNYINSLPNEVKQLKPNYKRIFALITDGEDNESRLFTSDDLCQLISKFKNDGVVCMFLGANQDAIIQGNKYGFSSQQSLTYSQNQECANSAFRSMSQNIRTLSSGYDDVEFNELQRSQSYSPSRNMSPNSCVSPPDLLKRC